MFRSKQYATAKQLYTQCLEEQPHDISILSNLAAVHVQLEEYRQALQHAQAGLKLQANHVKCLYRCGVAQAQLGMFAEAVTCLEQAKQQVRTRMLHQCNAHLFTV